MKFAKQYWHYGLGMVQSILIFSLFDIKTAWAIIGFSIAAMVFTIFISVRSRRV